MLVAYCIPLLVIMGIVGLIVAFIHRKDRRKEGNAATWENFYKEEKEQKEKKEKTDREKFGQSAVMEGREMEDRKQKMASHSGAFAEPYIIVSNFGAAQGGMVRPLSTWFGIIVLASMGICILVVLGYANLQYSIAKSTLDYDHTQSGSILLCVGRDAVASKKNSLEGVPVPTGHQCVVLNDQVEIATDVPGGFMVTSRNTGEFLYWTDAFLFKNRPPTDPSPTQRVP